jgi:drug/metabolite transporter (DMT)-like permease
MKTTTGLLQLDQSDFIKGLVMAVLSAVLTTIYQAVLPATMGKPIEFQWNVIGAIALTTAIAYLLKNLFTNNQDQFLKKDTP